MLYTFKENEFLVWVSYFMQRGFPLLERINELIYLLQAGGFVAKWDQDIVFLRSKGQEISKNLSLTIEHLEGAFYLLFIGLSSSVIVFICEICRNKGCKRNNLEK